MEVWTVDAHDLALSKVVRGAEHDERQLVEIHTVMPFDLDVLVERFDTEMSPVGNPRTIELNFLDLIELLFGELARVSTERRRRR